MFRYIIMGANTRRCSQTQNKIIASKTELPVKKLNFAFLRNSMLLITLSQYFTLRKGIPRLRDSVIFLNYFRVTLSCNSVYSECVEQY